MPKSSKMHGKKAATTALVAPYVPTPAECTALSQVLERGRNAKPYIETKVEQKGGRMHISWDHPSQDIARILWADSLGTDDMAFGGLVLSQLAQIAATGPALTDQDLNLVLSIVRGLAPTDPTEALLAAQMAAVHNAMMAAARRLALVEGTGQQDSGSTMFNKLARTFAAQVEALKRYRLKGEQIIKVQHVTINDGGRAIVGDVQHAPGGSLKSERRSHELTPPDAPGTALLGNVQTNGQSMPSPCREGQTRVPVSRGSSGSAKRSRQRQLSTRQLHE